MINVREISTPALAYLGDCVIELCVRRMLVERGLSTSAHLNAAALNYVRAPAQAEAMKRLAEHLTEEEAAFFRRGIACVHLFGIGTEAGAESVLDLAHLKMRVFEFRFIYVVSRVFEQQLGNMADTLRRAQATLDDAVARMR